MQLRYGIDIVSRDNRSVGLSVNHECHFDHLRRLLVNCRLSELLVVSALIILQILHRIGYRDSGTILNEVADLVLFSSLHSYPQQRFSFARTILV